MPRNYDEMAASEDRSFIIRGEKFTIGRGSVTLVGELEKLQKEFIDSKASEYSDVMDFTEKRLALMIDDQNGAVGRLHKLVEQGDIGYGELVDMASWGYEVITGLPTTPPAPSAPGPGRTAASSKAG